MVKAEAVLVDVLIGTFLDDLVELHVHLSFEPSQLIKFVRGFAVANDLEPTPFGRFTRPVPVTLMPVATSSTERT